MLSILVPARETQTSSDYEASSFSHSNPSGGCVFKQKVLKPNKQEKKKKGIVAKIVRDPRSGLVCEK